MARKSKRKTSPYLLHNKVEFVNGGATYFELIETLIYQAKDTIHLQTYIFEEDETGTAIAGALMDAARRKVKVYVLVDGFGSRALSDEFISALTSAGVHFRKFQPLFKSRYYYFGRRLHHKIFVADDYFGVVGGINIGNRYNDMPGEPAWFDRALLVEGEVPAELARVCMRRMRSGRATDQSERAALPKEKCRVRIRVNDWVRGKNQITRSYVEMCRNAEERIIIMSSYFLPWQHLKRSLRRAVARGVRVQVVMGRKSDLVLARYAEEYMYDWLFRHHIEVFEYTKNVMHAKLALYDGKWMTIGSYNVNDLSAYASIELNLDVANEEFAAQVQDSVEQIIAADCIRVTPTDFEKKAGLLKRMTQGASYHLYRVILFLLTFYFKPQRRKKS